MKVHRTPPEGVRVVRRTINYANGARIFEPNASRQFAVGDVGRQFVSANASRRFAFGGTGRQFAWGGANRQFGYGGNSRQFV